MKKSRRLNKLATDNFSEENILGKGGFGEVFKAVLEDNNVVAVKKLLVQHARAKEEFENEVRLISNVHHRNLLRLLGWSIEESCLLLVLEYMPNGSLDRFLWDFGLARFQPEDQTHVSTKFAGTLGYTAPEYALHGVLSEKVDTYSFGIVVLEIISGRRSTDVGSDAQSTYYLLENVRCHIDTLSKFFI
uniref:Putative tyrosine-protein kinase, neurotrophic receptor, type 2 n=1 Tax=Helianthus annuus TaxID=4232 RepID=A0A251SHX5_HELAN